MLFTIRDQVASIATIITENIYLDLKRTFNSKIVRITLSKKTNNGQISKFLKIFNIDISKKIKEFAKDYMSESFVKGAGEIIINIMTSILLYNVDNEKDVDFNNHRELIPFDITITIGQEPKTQKAFRWYTNFKVKDGFIEFSEHSDLSNSIAINAEYEEVLNPKTIYDFGPLSKYTVEPVSKFSSILKNLKPNTKYFYRVGSKKHNSWSEIYSFKTPKNQDEFTFLTLADSQGMVKSNYDLFNKVFNASTKKIKDYDFVVHLGDFVDDGNNENYWEWLLENNNWRSNTIVPVAGNHEARVNHVILKSGAENSITCHFNIQNFPKQDTSTGIYYSFVYNNATFVVLNTNDLDDNKKISSDQIKWAIDVFKNSKTKWKIALMHKSPYSNGPHHDDDDVLSISEQIVEFCDTS